MTDAKSSRGARNQQVARAGEHFVVAELNKRGAYAVPFAGNMPHVDVIACDQNENRTVHLQVKSKRGGRTWHSSIVGCRPIAQPPAHEDHFWVFVDLGDAKGSPRYWIVPDWWIRDDIYKHHQAYLDRHGGKRPGNPDSTHHAIEERRLNEWYERWDILDIC